MNIDNLTFGELKQIAAMFSGQPSAALAPGLSAMIGEKCVVRTYSAGVWYGEIAEKSGNEVIIKNARRLWYWKAAKSISLSAVALHGVSDASKIVAPVDRVWLEAIELIPATAAAAASIEGAPHVEAS